jgi:hypothetical protein
VSLGVNAAVFALVYRDLGNLGGAALGVLCGMCVTYLVCDLVIFRERRKSVRAAHAAPLRAAYARAARRTWLGLVLWLRPGQPVPTAGRHRAIPAWEQGRAVPAWEQT